MSAIATGDSSPDFGSFWWIFFWTFDKIGAKLVQKVDRKWARNRPWENQPHVQNQLKRTQPDPKKGSILVQKMVQKLAQKVVTKIVLAPPFGHFRATFWTRFGAIFWTSFGAPSGQWHSPISRFPGTPNRSFFLTFFLRSIFFWSQLFAPTFQKVWRRLQKSVTLIKGENFRFFCFFWNSFCRTLQFEQLCAKIGGLF